ncbi:hypothetical protein PR048_018089 [Dryococelus australis]|uniref:Integrase catalytic domain-containing protein n=1 Tax=Dryococelus australis TaxID=614101 RepID=A0ABQ9HBW6_9NEOP|nr:hypothetical protein PR048_018089 [Dryococelus australis]
MYGKRTVATDSRRVCVDHESVGGEQQTRYGGPVYPAKSKKLWENVIVWSRDIRDEAHGNNNPTMRTISLGMDIFELGRQTFFEVIHLPNTTSVTIGSQIKNIFAWHGIPEVVHTDGGQHFTLAEFKQFAKDYGFALSTSSPKFAQ